MLSYEVHFYFSEATTHVSSVKTLIGSNHVKAIGRQGTDVCFFLYGRSNTRNVFKLKWC